MFFLLTLSSAVGLAFGNIFESIGLRKANSAKSLAKNKFWLGGLGLSAIATLLYYAAMAEYNISLVQPFMALNPALTAILGWKILGERMTRKVAFAIALIFCGLLIDGTMAGESSEGFKPKETLWIYAVAVLALLAVFCSIFRTSETVDSLCAGVGFGLSAVFYKSISLEGLFPPPVDLRIFAFAVLYLAAFLCSQIGLRRGRALFVIPLSAAVGLVVPAIGGVAGF
ncbi:MAG: EamA family transporter, partial [Fibromonadales bacterium]|nr:EamA family transporter [Fibromonadales bacterium]